MTYAEHPHLNGRHPEFARMSNRPGIGAKAADVFAEQLMNAGEEEIPYFVKRAGKNLILGRYLINRLRSKIYGDDADKVQAAKDQWLSEASGEMLRLWQNAKENKNWNKEVHTVSSLVVEEAKGRLASVKAKYKIDQSRGKKL